MQKELDIPPGTSCTSVSSFPLLTIPNGAPKARSPMISKARYENQGIALYFTKPVALLVQEEAIPSNCLTQRSILEYICGSNSPTDFGEKA